jgi:uncharacterized SAM-binding protein YcdF (DUF218 family)
MRRRAVAWLGALVTFAVGYALIAAWLTRAGEHAVVPDETFDAIVVLGCRVDPSGRPSHALRRRAEHAARLYHRGAAPWVVTTGGVGDFGPSEASVARDVLVKAGVPEQRILLEDASTSTDENARFAKERFGGRRVLVVTDAYHVPRSERVFLRYFEDAHAVGTSSPFSRVRVVGALREVFAVAAYLGLGRLSWASRGGPEGAPPRGPSGARVEPAFALTATVDERRRA